MNDIEKRVLRLEEQISALQDRLDDLVESKDTPTGTMDHYDGQVLDSLTRGEVYGLSELRRLYKRAGIRDKETLRSRIEYITSEFCESVGTQRWRFTGREGREGREVEK